MTWLVTGATGLLGRRVMQTLRARNIAAVGLARSGADITCDITDSAALLTVLDPYTPKVIVNCAAMVDLGVCERDPQQAFAVNAEPVKVLAQWAQAHRARLVQISTDQFFTGDDLQRHAEDAMVQPCNVYAASKFQSEQYGLSAGGALIVRTNLTDITTSRAKPAFARWALDTAKQGAVPGFADYYCSTIDTLSLSEAIVDLVQAGAAGIFNVASRDVFSKAEFIESLFAALGIQTPVTPASAKGMSPSRCLSAGLDVGKVERLLNRSMPSLAQVTARLAQLYREDVHAV